MVRLRKPYQYYFVNTLLENFYEVLKYMSEVFICRGGSGSGGGGSSGGKKKLITEIIDYNTNWTPPANIINGEVSIRIFGGGGGGTNASSGGGSGWMNNGTYKLDFYTSYPITIGKGGRCGVDTSSNSRAYSGGTTSFGTILSAHGGDASYGYEAGKGGAGGYGYNGDGYQFGGGGVSSFWGSVYEPGNGGVWGGGGGSCRDDEYMGSTHGGNGGYYGGGGGCDYIKNSPNNRGCGGVYNKDGKIYLSGLCGNGGRFNVAAENGTNTIGWTNILKDKVYNEYLNGNGIAGMTWEWNDESNKNVISNVHLGGGGGFGGVGGNGYKVYSSYNYWYGGGGGGGYGSKGGDGTRFGAGGGGGYGGNGGDGYDFYSGSGGGYGKGADGNGYGGGGYYSPSLPLSNRNDSRYNGPGAAGYFINGEYYGYGGFGYYDGIQGVCILSYYVNEE